MPIVVRRLRISWVEIGAFSVLSLEGAVRLTIGYPASGTNFSKITSFSGDIERRRLALVICSWRLLFAIHRSGAHHVFLCHYEKTFILLTAVVLRGFGRRVYTMFDSKYDDYPRYLWREYLKSQFFLPYQGCLAASIRSQDYVRFLGIRRDADQARR